MQKGIALTQKKNKKKATSPGANQVRTSKKKAAPLDAKQIRALEQNIAQKEKIQERERLKVGLCLLVAVAAFLALAYLYNMGVMAVSQKAYTILNAVIIPVVLFPGLPAFRRLKRAKDETKKLKNELAGAR